MPPLSTAVSAVALHRSDIRSGIPRCIVSALRAHDRSMVLRLVYEAGQTSQSNLELAARELQRLGWSSSDWSTSTGRQTLRHPKVNGMHTVYSACGEALRLDGYGKQRRR